MGQYWMILNLDCRDRFDTLAKLGETFFDGYEWMTRVLTEPVIPAPLAVRADSSKSSLGALALPVEIILMIFHELKDVEDAMYLSIAHPTLEAIGATHLHALRLAEHAPWIGDRLVCIGDYAKLDDLPTGMLSSAERAEVNTLPRSGDSKEPNLDGFAYHACKDFTRYLSKKPFGATGMAFERMRDPDRSRFIGMHKAAYGADEWVLCNLSKQEFVLSRTIKDLTREETTGPLRDGLIGFGMAQGIASG
ncbi:hypothetical protein FA95DRAFT_1606108 [Auriscalpium vulgare]|uniref:Uncharacterized protein n=1 Tax=Auriscalpium vulgare TaxID=40419 RepID=A0ACB8RTQ3_9AGAM|nr:hypothetical protein FA95DRAFT_1606108 [Auriscalpium vulgare]